MRCIVHSVVFAFLFVLITAGLANAQPSTKPKATPKPTPVTKAATAASAAAPVAKASAVKCSTNGLIESEITTIVSGHNKARKEQGLQPLVWDCSLANLAQDWASKSVFAHRDSPYGENIFVASDPAAPVSSVLERWMAEKVNWTNATGTCAAGKVCFHYTQVMWKATTKVGCGINRNAVGKWKAMLVCNYDPASLSEGPAY